MRHLVLRTLAAVTTAAAVGLALSPVAAADPAVVVYPGMEIHQDNNVCTLGYVDPALRVAFAAGHCRGGGGPVTDKDGRMIGMLTTFRDNTPDGATVTTDQVIADYEAITLSKDISVNNILPGGRALFADQGVVPKAGQSVCHFGIVTGESCGTVERVNNGWFTMTNGVVSQKGDSGGPVYVLADDGRAVIIGLFNSTWGQFPAAVSWQATGQQVREDVAVVTNTSRPA